MSDLHIKEIYELKRKQTMNYTKKTTFKPNHYYHYGNLDKFGFEAILLCTNRVNHRDGDAHVSFTLMDIKINDFNIGARTFVAQFTSKNKYLMFLDEEYETIDTYYWTICAEDEVKGPNL